MSKRVKSKKKKKNAKVAPIQKEEKSLVVVDKKKLGIAVIREKEVFKKVVKGVSLALIGTISVAYILLMALVATSVFYVSHLQNGLIQKGVFVNGINVSDLSRRRGFWKCDSCVKQQYAGKDCFEI